MIWSISICWDGPSWSRMNAILTNTTALLQPVLKALSTLSPQDMLNQVDLPEEWLRKLAEKTLSEADKAEIEALGGFDKLMETLRKRLEEQKGRHQGGSKWVGTAGTSPFGAYGYNPEGVRIGQAESRHQRAVKVWDKRSFKNLDGDVELGTRNIKVALKRPAQMGPRWGAGGIGPRRHNPQNRRKWLY